MTRTREEIHDMLDKALSWVHVGATSVSGMTYEQGVEYALRWALGEEEPVEEEYCEEAADEIEPEKGDLY